MAKTSKKVLGATMTGVMAVGAIAGAVHSVDQVNVANAATSKAQNDAKAKISHLTWSLKNNYLGLKNQGQWEQYIKEAKALIAKMPTAEKTVAAALTAEVNRDQELVNGLARINQVEKSYETNFKGIKNASTWRGYLDLATTSLKSVDQKEFANQYAELVSRLNVASNNVKKIEDDYKAQLDAATKLYDAAVTSNNIDDATKALTAAKALGTHPSTAELQAKCEELISTIQNAKFEVSSIEAPNAKEMVIKFSQAVNKDTVIRSHDTDSLKGKLIDNTITVDGTALNGNFANLSADGKTLTVQMADGIALGKTYTVGINKEASSANYIQSTKGEKLSEVSKIVKIEDATRATFVKTEKVDPNTVRVYFSEPVKKPATNELTAQYNDGTAATVTASQPTASAAVNYVDLDISGLSEGKDAVVTFAGINDYATPVNVSKPIAVTVNRAEDKTEVNINSITATSNKTFEVKMSKQVESVNPSNIKVNGVILNGTVEVNTTDKTIINVTLTNSTSEVVPVEIGAGAVTDFSGNTNKTYSNLVNFDADKVAPQVVSTKVVTDGGNNHLIVNFDEKIVKPTAGFGDLTFKYVDKMGVEQTATVEGNKVSIDPSNNKALKILLTSDTGSELVSNTDYKVELPAGYVEDSFGNKFVKKEITFTLGTVSQKLEASSIEQTAPGVITVNFNGAVDAASATNVQNYSVEDATVDSVKLVANDQTGNAKVEVYLKDNTVKTTGRYNVTVKGVKGYNANTSVMDLTTKNISIKENVRANVNKVVVESLGAISKVNLTFSEAVSNANDTHGKDFALFIDGKEVSNVVTVAAATIGSEVNTLVVSIDKDLTSDIANGKTIKLVAKDTLNIKDKSNNKLAQDDIVIK